MDRCAIRRILPLVAFYDLVKQRGCLLWSHASRAWTLRSLTASQTRYLLYAYLVSLEGVGREVEMARSVCLGEAWVDQRGCFNGQS